MRASPKLQILSEFQSVLARTYQKWLKKGKLVKRREGHERPRFTDAPREQKLALVVQPTRGATVAQVAEKVHAGSNGKVSKHTVHYGLLCSRLCSCRPVHVAYQGKMWLKMCTTGRLPADGGSVMLWAMLCC